jgi:hypothetical protein
MVTGAMPQQMSHRGRRGGAVLLLSLSAACGAGTPAPVDSPQGSRTMSAQSADDSLYRISLREPTVTQRLEPVAGAQARPRFVRIEVTAVTNPARMALTLELRYRLADRETVLGSVSLFPADNPGRFIVPTLGRLGAEGELMLTLVSPDSGAGRQDVRVTVRRLVFVDE